MITRALARLCSGRLHYAWIVLVVMFVSMLAGVGVRAAPGVMIVPLQHAFGWDVATISGAVSINIILLGATGPFITGLIDIIGLKRTILGCMTILMAGTVPVDLHDRAVGAVRHLGRDGRHRLGRRRGRHGGGGGEPLVRATHRPRDGIADRGERGGPTGFSPPAGHAGEPLRLAGRRDRRHRRDGGRGAVARDHAAGIAGLGGAGRLWLDHLWQPPARRGNPFSVAFAAFGRGARSLDFWLLAVSFGICGFSTNGLINTHLIAYCADHGIPEVHGASILAVIGVFSLIGSTLSGWACDRYNPRVLLFWYYGLRGLSLVILPFTQFDSSAWRYSRCSTDWTGWPPDRRRSR